MSLAASMHLARRPAASAPRDGRLLRRLCYASAAGACVLYLASPYVALWSFGVSLRHHDDAALNASVDWRRVRASLRRRFAPPMSQPDELPTFGSSFEHRVATRMIDLDVTPARLDSMLTSRGLTSRNHHDVGWPHGFFVSPDRFDATIRMSGEAPVVIDMRIECWRWKFTRIIMPTGTQLANSGN